MPDPYSRIAVITGATSGIGEATVRKFAAAGFGVVGNGRSEDKLVALEKELGGAFCGIAGDASDPHVVDALLAAPENRFGRPAGIVVANAGRGLGGSVKDADLSRFEEMMRVNVTAVLWLIQKAARKMADDCAGVFPESAGDIVVTGSVVGRHISPFSAVYGASKFAVHALVEGLRREMGPKGVRVSLVEPGMVITGFQAGAGYDGEMVNGLVDRFGPLPSPDDVANAIHYIVTQPPSVHICDIVVRPTRQDYP